MPLSQQLKSEMTGFPTEMLPKKEDESHVAESGKMPDFNNSKSSEIPPSEEGTTSSTETHLPSPDHMALLLSIESQLKGLSDNILSLGKAVSDIKSPDYRAVFAKIDAARMSIEKLLPTNNIDSASETESVGSQLLALLQTILDKQEKNDRQLAQSLRDNANFQIQVRQGMQRDLDKLKEQLTGEQFNPILKEIASTYVEYQSLLDDESISERSRKNLYSLFEQLEDILSDYGADVCRSEIGAVRQTKTCKIIEKIPTGQQEKHNTVASSRKPGVVRDRVVLYPEFVDVYVYDPFLAEGPDDTIEGMSGTDAPTACKGEKIETADAENAAFDNDTLGGNE